MLLITIQLCKTNIQNHYNITKAFLLIFNEKAYFFRRKKGEEQKKTRSILLNLVPCYLEPVLIGQPHMLNLYFGSIFVYIPLSVPWLRTTRIIIFRRCRDKRFMFLSFLCNKDSDEFFLIPNVFSVFYIESSKCIILYKWKRLCISR